MITYLIIYLFNFSLAFLSINYRKAEKIFYTLSLLLLSLFLGFSYLNGLDWTFYQENFINVPYFFSDNFNFKNLDFTIKSNEYGIVILMSLFKSFGFNFEIFRFVVLSFSLFIIYKTIKKMTPYSLIAIMIYFSQFLLGNFFEPVFRQILAMSIFFISLKYIEKRSIFKYIILIIISTFFHSSAIILLPFYFWGKNRINFIKGIGIFFIIILFSYYLEDVIKITANIIPPLKHYLIYFKLYYGQGMKKNLIRILISFLITIFPLFLLDKKFNIENKNFKFNIVYNFSWIYVYFKFLSTNMIIFYRLAMYFGIFYCVLLSYLVYIPKKKMNKISTVLIIGIIYLRVMMLDITYWKDTDYMKFYPYTNYVISLIKNENFKDPIEKIKYRRRFKLKATRKVLKQRKELYE